MKKILLPSLALFALAFSGLACAQKAAPALRILKVQGEEYASACTPQNKSALQAQLTTDAWPLVETLLCEKKSASSRAYIADHINKTVKRASTSTGSPDTSSKAVVNAALIDSLLSEGEAWDADLTVTDKEIVVKYMPNEACIRGRTLQLNQSKWKITALDEACD
jgi:hypothetical protein